MKAVGGVVFVEREGTIVGEGEGESEPVATPFGGSRVGAVVVNGVGMSVGLLDGT